MDCYACDQEATQRCSLCGNSYCHDHGDDPSTGSGQAVCADCLRPVNAVPSGGVFRASIFALFLASVLALWLLVQPPSLPGESPEPKPSPTSTPVAPGRTPTPTRGSTPSPTVQPTPSPTPSLVEYIVKEGDTLLGIAQQYAPPSVAPFTFAQQIAALNKIDFTNPMIHPGDKLLIPR